jgi:hypothetical protein
LASQHRRLRLYAGGVFETIATEVAKNPPAMITFIALMATSGVLWTATYLLIIRAGFIDKVCGMPLAALCANLAWETIFVFIYPHPPYQLPADVVWLVIDSIIAYQMVRYHKAMFPMLGFGRFLALFIVGLVTAGCLIGFVGNLMDDRDGVYAAFGQNLMMSVLFVGWLATRPGLPGQRLSIAVLKMLGTLAASSAFVAIWWLDPDKLARRGDLEPILVFLFVAIFVFDLMYVIGVWRRSQTPRPMEAAGA